jgi:hypothetical protein
MITAIVQFRLPQSIDLKACAEHFRKIAPGFRTVPGLISPASASATAWTRRSSIPTPLA